MNFKLPAELKILKQTVKDFVESEVEPIADEIERKGKVPSDIGKKMVELGYCGLAIPQEYGGQGLGILAQCLVYEQFGPYTGLAIRMSPGLVCEAIVEDGTDEQKKKYLPDIAEGKLAAAIAITEPDAGSDFGNISTSAIKKGDNFILNGRKHFITNGDIADIVLVMVFTNRNLGPKRGITALLVEKGTPGFSVGRIQEAMGLAGCTQAELIFEDCLVPSKNIIGKEGGGYELILKYLNRGRLYTGAIGLGIAEKALKMSIEYAGQRVQFGRPISQYQAIQWMLADSATDIYATKLMIYNAAWKLDQGLDATIESAMVKLFASEMAGRVVDRAVQIFGGMGYMKEMPIERFYRDVRFTRIVEGTSEIQRIIIANKLLKGAALL